MYDHEISVDYDANDYTSNRQEYSLQSSERESKQNKNWGFGFGHNARIEDERITEQKSKHVKTISLFTN